MSTQLKAGKLLIECNPSSFRPATDSDPPELPDLGIIKVYLKSRNEWRRVYEDNLPDAVIERIWRELEDYDY